MPIFLNLKQFETCKRRDTKRYFDKKERSDTPGEIYKLFLNFALHGWLVGCWYKANCPLVGPRRVGGWPPWESF